MGYVIEWLDKHEPALRPWQTEHLAYGVRDRIRELLSNRRHHYGVHGHTMSYSAVSGLLRYATRRVQEPLAPSVLRTISGEFQEFIVCTNSTGMLNMTVVQYTCKDFPGVPVRCLLTVREPCSVPADFQTEEPHT